MKILVTIAARGGSKGVKNKNVRELCGKPLIAYTIDQALRWGRASRVVVSTDSAEIAAAAKRYGAEVPFLRPPELSTDTAPKVPVIRHAWREAERIYGETYDFVVDLDATAPLRRRADLDASLSAAAEKRADMIFSAVPSHKNPYFNMVELDSGGYARLCKKPGNGVNRRQDAPKVYDLNASIYVYTREFLLGDSQTVLTDRSRVHVMDELSGVDIDREVDFKFVEFIIKQGLWKFEP
ncbi:MAG TPA: acylneuraminate cytidylyltransferase family protein [Elusimicrobiales bacterium]|nr:acylneuraminate cytidylyltransferase family protein [Elusimicrobiales bacterium]